MGKHRAKLRARSHPRPSGAPPGLLEPTPGAAPGKLHVIVYGPNHLEEGSPADATTLGALRSPGRVLWVNVDGVGDPELVRQVGESFGLHTLALEDVMNTEQRPKTEEYDFGLYVVARMPEEGGDGTKLEQLSVFIGSGFVLTFQERPGDCLDPVRERIRTAKGRIRRMSSAYLGYAILDAVVDAYFPVADHQGDRLDALEEAILSDRPHGDPARELWAIKRGLIAVRRVLVPMRDAIARVSRSAHTDIGDDVRLYLRDVEDHATRLAELIESYRDVAGGLLDVHLNMTSNRTNEVMKVLTMMASLFIPLSFVAGVYGMNFDPDASPFNMPELGARYGYPAALAFMGAIATTLLVWFRRKGWL